MTTLVSRIAQWIFPQTESTPIDALLPMTTYNIFVHRGQEFEFDCQVTAKTPQQAMLKWRANNLPQQCRTIKATPLFA